MSYMDRDRILYDSSFKIMDFIQVIAIVILIGMNISTLVLYNNSREKLNTCNEYKRMLESANIEYKRKNIEHSRSQNNNKILYNNI